MKAAKRRGLHVGRPKKLTRQQINHARELMATGQESQAAIAALLSVDVKTLRRTIAITREHRRLRARVRSEAG